MPAVNPGRCGPPIPVSHLPTGRPRADSGAEIHPHRRDLGRFNDRRAENSAAGEGALTVSPFVADERECRRSWLQYYCLMPMEDVADRLLRRWRKAGIDARPAHKTRAQLSGGQQQRSAPD